MVLEGKNENSRTSPSSLAAGWGYEAGSVGLRARQPKFESSFIHSFTYPSTYPFTQQSYLKHAVCTRDILVHWNTAVNKADEVPGIPELPFQKERHNKQPNKQMCKTIPVGAKFFEETISPS